MTVASLVVRCPAKVNLQLRVLGRRDDGYHELRVVFQSVDLWDTLEARPARSLTLACDDPALPTDGSNLVLRAALRLRERASRAGQGAALTLRKRIPSGGGLGGASSDAAGALLVLSRLWALSVGLADLEPVASELGADVPFFLHGGTALGTGRGDRITPLPPLGEHPVLLGLPPFGLSTAEVYARFSRLTHPANDVSLSRFSTDKLPGGNDFGFAINDLEAVVFEGWPELRAFRDALLETGARCALLSGSGSTVFGVFADAAGLQRATEGLRVRFPRWRFLPTRTIRAAAHLATDDTGVR